MTRPRRGRVRLRLALPLALAALAGCGGHSPPTPRESPPLPTRGVAIAPARETSQALGDEVVGTVRSRNSAVIAASVMGTVRSLRVSLGSAVKAGEVLITLSAGEIEAKVSQAKALYAQARLELERAESLKSSKSIPASQYDAAVAQHEAAKAALTEAQVMRKYMVIRAPISGVVTAKEADVGDLALPGRPLLVLESPGQLRLEAAVPEAVAHAITLGASMPVWIDGLSQSLEGKVAELSPAADPQSRTVLVKLDLPSEPALRAGMFGRLSVRTGQEDVVVVDAAALVPRGQMETVFVVDDGGVARLRLVRSGRRHGDEVEVLAGLDAGERVVVSDASSLRDGQPVESSGGTP